MLHNRNFIDTSLNQENQEMAMQHVGEDTLKFLQEFWGKGYVVHLAYVGQAGEGGW